MKLGSHFLMFPWRSIAGPKIGLVTGVSKNGSIYLQWSLLSIGGIPEEKVTVGVECATLNSNSMDKDITYSCNQNCIDSNLNGSGLVGSVYAGFLYSCVVTVSNVVEFKSALTSTIYTKTGEPVDESIICYFTVI